MNRLARAVLVSSIILFALSHACVADAPATQPAEGYKVNLKSMSLFPFDSQNGTLNDIPKQFRDLDGQRVRFIGEMWRPTLRDDGSVASFQAIYSATKWSFREAPHVQDFWRCTPVEGVMVRPMNSMIEVTGILHVRILKQDESIQSVYDVDVESVKPSTGDFAPTTKPAATQPR